MRNFLPRDWGKFIVAILLVVLLFAFGLAKDAPVAEATVEIANPTEEPAPPTAEPPPPTEAPPEPTPQPTEAADPAMTLPDFPAGAQDFTYEAATGQLLDADGNPVYELDESGTMWKPVMPTDASADDNLTQDSEGNWVVNGSDDATKNFWDPVTNSWQPVGPAEEEPAANEAPGIPDELAATLPAGYQVSQDDSGAWQILSAEGNLLSTWDAATGTWTAVEPDSADQSTEPAADPEATVACESGEPSQLAVGDTARVQLSLNLRETPGIANNWILTMVAGTEVTVIGQPECLPYGEGNYLWWPIELPDGTTGWAAEAPIYGAYYFMEPAE